MNTPHIVKSFDEELSAIDDMILEMGGIVENQINEAIVALSERNTELAEKVRSQDKRVDLLEAKVDEASVRVLALRQPFATDLRNVVCALKISNNLERIGDYAKNIAKRTLVIAPLKSVGSSEKTIRRMGVLVQKMVVDVLNAYVARDVAAADEVRARDEEVDHFHNTLFRELLTHMMEDPRNITVCMHMLFIAKNVERIGDHTTAIAEQIHYMITGSLPTDERPKGDRTSEMVPEITKGKSKA